jgi:uncharacterized membrane protein YfcA
MSDILSVAPVLLIGGMIQSITGFGFGLFALPPLLLMGLDLPQAVVLIIVGSAVQKMTATAHLRRSVKWRQILPLMGVGLLTLPLGVYLMARVSAMDQAFVKQILGACILLLLLIRIWGARKTPGTPRAGWGYFAASLSGLLNGFANIGGPPMVLWTLAHRWPNARIRGTLLAFSLVFVPFQIILIWSIFGSTVGRSLIHALILIPVVLFGTWLGLRLGEKIPTAVLRGVMVGVLLLMAVISLVEPLIRG